MIKLRIASKECKKENGLMVMSMNSDNVLYFLNIDGIDCMDLTNEVMPDLCINFRPCSTTADFTLATGEKFKNISVLYGE